MKELARSAGDRIFGTSQPRVLQIPVKKILLGGEGDLRARQYASLTGDILRPSTRASSGPHAKFLAEYQRLGEKIFERGILETTPYFKNTRDCLRVFGDYFPGIATPDRIVLAAKRFALQYEGKSVAHIPTTGHSSQGEIIKVFTVKDSDCYELLQGNHRVAFATQKNEEFIIASVDAKPQHTPLQEMVLTVAWESGARELYQPLELPEFEDSWILLRNCRGRFERMIQFLKTHGLAPDRIDRIIDIGSYYGWFVSQFISAGYNAQGIERDRQAIRIGELVYGNLESKILWDDARIALQEETGEIDVVCCLSVMHHYVMGKFSATPDEFLRVLNQKTRRVLFFEMGEEHEQWFGQSLAGWNKDAIKKWVLNNTDFKVGHELGRDGDDHGKYKNNFGRMLFAFTK